MLPTFLNFLSKSLRRPYLWVFEIVYLGTSLTKKKNLKKRIWKMGVKLLSRKLKLLTPQIPRLIVECLNDLEKEIVELNKSQLREGKRSDGSILGRYSESTKRRKRADPSRHLTGDYISLLDTGDFWKSFIFEATENTLFFGATDEKSEMLIREWGNTILGLSPEGYAKLAELIRPLLIEKINKFIAEA